jgi:hypothetical protein
VWIKGSELETGIFDNLPEIHNPVNVVNQLENIYNKI